MSGLESADTRGLASAYPTNAGARTAADKDIPDLTRREQQVLAELELGLPNKLIAARLKLSENTVKMHIQHIMRKCAAHNRTEAVHRWRDRLSGLHRGIDTEAASLPES
jgi:DNA-binding NarL/FixJ family response regulator